MRTPTQIKNLNNQKPMDERIKPLTNLAKKLDAADQANDREAQSVLYAKIDELPPYEQTFIIDMVDKLHVARLPDISNLPSAIELLPKKHETVQTPTPVTTDVSPRRRRANEFDVVNLANQIKRVLNESDNLPMRKAEIISELNDTPSNSLWTKALDHGLRQKMFDTFGKNKGARYFPHGAKVERVKPTKNDAQEAADKIWNVLSDTPKGRNEVLAETDLTPRLWSVGIKSLKDRDVVTQIGNKRSAKYTR